MSIKIEHKIVDYRVKSEAPPPVDDAVKTATAGSARAGDDVAASSAPAASVSVTEPPAPDYVSGDAHEPRPAKRKADVIQMHERVERPDVLIGSTYKIKTPLSEHALYVTINDIVLNRGTEHEQRRPFEVFINSKNMEHFQWIVALTRIVSAVFRKGGDVTFLVDELRSVFDPKGGYFKKGGQYMPSLVAEIGDAIESHLRSIGLIKGDGLDETQRRLIEQKRAEHTAATAKPASAPGGAQGSDDQNTEGAFPAEARFCGKCAQRAVIQMDGCMTCLSCGDSKCG